jgi:hypothetical protein
MKKVFFEALFAQRDGKAILQYNIKDAKILGKRGSLPEITPRRRGDFADLNVFHTCTDGVKRAKNHIKYAVFVA